MQNKIMSYSKRLTTPHIERTNDAIVRMNSLIKMSQSVQFANGNLFLMAFYRNHCLGTFEPRDVLNRSFHRFPCEPWNISIESVIVILPV